MELEGRRQELAARGLGLAALSPDPASLLHDFASRRGIGYPLLSDTDSSVIRAFGVLNEEIAADDPHHGIPHPGTLVIDAKGRVTKREFADGYAERRTVASLLDMPDGEASARIEAPGGIVVSLSASDDSAAMGRKLTLTAGLSLPEQAHLYAPGAQGYTALALELDPHPMVSPGDVRLPRSRVMKFKPTREKVPVFDGPVVRLEADVVVASGKKFMEWMATEPKALALTGTLRFQSCSKTACQPPASVPVAWTLDISPPDLERSPESLRRR